MAYVDTGGPRQTALAHVVIVALQTHVHREASDNCVCRRLYGEQVDIQHSGTARSEICFLLAESTSLSRFTAEQETKDALLPLTAAARGDRLRSHWEYNVSVSWYLSRFACGDMKSFGFSVAGVRTGGCKRVRRLNYL